MAARRDAPVIVLIDDRERTPLALTPYLPPGWWTVGTRRLETGDYSLDGLEDFIAIERKRPLELWQTVGRDRARFGRELARLAEIRRRPGGYAALVVEGSLPQVLEGGDAADAVFGRERGPRGITPAHVLGAIAAWSVQWDLPVWFAGRTDLAAKLVVTLLVQAAGRIADRKPV
jgi:DNA excision repair protein ERCC-4